MTMEISIVLKALILNLIWLFAVDLQLYNHVGMSPIFGSLKEDKVFGKAKMFSFSVGFNLILMSIGIAVYYKLTGKITNNFAFWKLAILTIGGMLLSNMLSWFGISIYLRKEDDVGNLIIAFSVTFGVLLIFLIGIFVAGGLPF
jgi:hypothetical protein